MKKGIPTKVYRIWVQTGFFALWAALVVSTKHPMDSWLARHMPVSFFLRIDPLVTTIVCGGLRVGVSILLLGFVTLVITLIMGRVFCGWVCPLGTIFDFYGWILRKAKINNFGPSPTWFRSKYYLLAAMLLLALLGGVSPLMGFDPIVIIHRVAAAVLMPLARHREQLTWSTGNAPGQNGYFIDLATLILFVGIMARTTKISRIWCRTACPLGAYLGAMSRHAVLRRDTKNCIQCGLCSDFCPTGAIDFKNAEKYNESECIKCFSCTTECPVDANFFHWTNPLPAFTPAHAPVHLERRDFMQTLGVAAVSAPILMLSGGAPASNKHLLRPPMSRDEHDFLSSCIRCEECVKACPTGVLKPAPLEHGIRALWSPVLIPKEGFCAEGCNACSQACPTDAILKYPIANKYLFKIGTAVFHAERCISNTENKFCSECVNVCPTKAIEVTAGWMPPGGHGSEEVAPEGQKPSRPFHINFDKCVGCGHCEFVCNQIVAGEVAMETTSFGRSIPTKL